MSDAHVRSANILLAEALGRAIDTGTVDAGLVACEASVWHCFDERDQSLQPSVAAAAAVRERLRALTRQDVRVHADVESVTIQYTLVAVAHDDREVRVPICAVLTVDDGRIARVEEYFDPARMAQVGGLLSSA